MAIFIGIDLTVWTHSFSKNSLSDIIYMTSLGWNQNLSFILVTQHLLHSLALSLKCLSGFFFLLLQCKDTWLSENINDVKNSQLNSHITSRGTSFQVSDTSLSLHEEEGTASSYGSCLAICFKVVTDLSFLFQFIFQNHDF